MSNHYPVSVTLCILLVALLGTVLGMQGWRSRVPDDPAIASIHAARALIQHGTLPERGAITSLGSYAPPGYAWTTALGILAFPDFRWFDAAGMILLNAGTLIGLFLLGRKCFGVSCGVLAVIGYGLSQRGLMFAGSLTAANAHEHPFFHVWVAYCVVCWSDQKDGRYLAGALFTWAIGLWCCMEIAPAAIMIIAIAVAARPPIDVRAAAVAIVASALLWTPYVTFEARRGFVDLRSQLLLTNIRPASYEHLLCDPRINEYLASPRAPDVEGRLTPVHGLAWAQRRMAASAVALEANFHSLLPGSGMILMTSTLGVLALLAFPGAAAVLTRRRNTSSQIALSALGLGAVVAALAPWNTFGFQPNVYDSAATRTGGAVVAILAVALLALPRRKPWIERLRAFLAPTPAARWLALALVSSWLAFSLITEPGREDRLLGLWPLQMIMLAAANICVFNALRGSLARWVVAGVIPVLVLTSPLIIERVRAWRSDGWSGTDATEIQAADALARRIRFQTRATAPIGYQLLANDPEPPSEPVTSSDWKAGREFDFILDYRNGIVNSDRCGEGASSLDEYRIVENAPTGGGEAYAVPVPRISTLSPFGRVGNYELFEKR